MTLYELFLIFADKIVTTKKKNKLCNGLYSCLVEKTLIACLY